MATEVKLWLEVMTFDANSAPKRITIPVDATRIGNTEDWHERVRVMNSDTLKMWQLGSLAGKEYEEKALAREAELLKNHPTK